MVQSFVRGLTIILACSLATASAAEQWAQVETTPVAYFGASPTSGKAPLVVTFCATAGIGVDFGDGTTAGLSQGPTGICRTGGLSATHTYAAAGIYRVKGFPCPGSHNTDCGEVANQASAVVITVLAGP